MKRQETRHGVREREGVSLKRNVALWNLLVVTDKDELYNNGISYVVVNRTH